MSEDHGKAVVLTKYRARSRINRSNADRIRAMSRKRNYAQMKVYYDITPKQLFCMRMGTLGVKRKDLTECQKWFLINDVLNCARVLTGKDIRSWKDNPYLGGDSNG